MKITSTLLATLLASSLLPAIERPGTKEDQLPALPVAENAEAAEQPAAAAEASAWLGVAGFPIDDILAEHLGITQGIALEMVAPESPADQTGLQARDIITSVNGKAIASQDDLREAIMKHQAGDEVTLGLVRKGKAIDQKVTLGERPAQFAGPGPQVLPFGQDPALPRNLPGNLPELLQKEVERHLMDMQEQPLAAEELQRMLQEMQNRQVPAPGNNPGLNLKMQTSITVRDAEGSVEIRKSNGAKEVFVRNHDGEIIFEGPYETPQDQAAVPDGIRERVEKADRNFPALEAGQGNRFQFKLKGQNPRRDE